MHDNSNKSQPIFTHIMPTKKSLKIKQQIEQITLTFVMCFVFILPSKAQQKVLVFDGNVKVGEKGYELTYALAKGDEIELNLSTEKDKKLKEVIVEPLMAGKALFKGEKVLPFSGKKFKIDEEGVYRFFFRTGTFGNRLSHITIERTPAAEDSRFFNPAWEYISLYDTTTVDYQTDSLLGYQEPIITQQELKIFNKYVYQSQTFLNEHKQVLGRYGVHNSQSKCYPFKLPELPNIEGIQLKYMTYGIQSVLGGAKHWKAANIGATIAGTFMNPAAGFAANQAMDIIGPEPGGEPIRYFFTTDIEDAKTVHNSISGGQDIKQIGKAFKSLFTGEDATDEPAQLKAVTEMGSVTNLYNASWALKPQGYIVLYNLARTKAKNTDVVFNAIYYAPMYNKVQAEVRQINIDTVTLDKSQKKIETRKEIRILK